MCYLVSMTRTEAIAIIEKALPVADEQTLARAAELFQSAVPEASALPRLLSARERALIVQSKADFAAGRTTSLEEGFALIDARLASAIAKSSTA